MLQKDLMSLTLYISSNCKSPIIYDFEFFLRVRSQSQIWWYFRRVRCQRLPAGEGKIPGIETGSKKYPGYEKIDLARERKFYI